VASFLTTNLVQTFLEGTKLTIQSIDSNLEDLVKNMTFGRLVARFDTSGWTGSGTTPSYVLQMMAMKYASMYYRRQYSESLEEDNNYSVYLDKTWDMILDQLLSGEMDIPGISTSAAGTPVFWPNDASTQLAETDPTNEMASPLMFQVGQQF